MEDTRAAFYLDFDNVFGGLYKLDPEAAIQFASSPKAWLRRLSTTLTLHPRRWLVLRCYLNPAGWVYHPDAAGEQTRLYFSKFRPGFVRSGFEVVDCPRYSATKNAADIRIVVDALDALSADTRYDEFVIASGDSDMTPLLQRLRRSDRRTMIVSPAEAAEAYTSIADQVLDGQQLLAVVQGEPLDLDEEASSSAGTEFDDRGIGVGELPTGVSDGYAAFRSFLVAAYEDASEPLNMAALASRVRTQLGRIVSDSNWFGLGSFARAVASLELPGLQMSQHMLWDEARHPAPEPFAGMPERIPMPEPIERLADQLALPRLPQSSWPVIYQVLSDYAWNNRFNLTECTRWSRDELRGQGLAVSRNAVAFVVRGVALGGCPLYRQPPPTAAEIRAAFVGNVFARAEAAEVVLSEDERAEVEAWLGIHSDPGAPVAGPDRGAPVAG